MHQTILFILIINSKVPLTIPQNDVLVLNYIELVVHIIIYLIMIIVHSMHKQCYETKSLRLVNLKYKYLFK